MNVDNCVRERALLNIFRKHHRIQKGCCLSARELDRAWKDTGLRHSDLHDGLHELTRRHLLHARHGMPGTEYELSYLGERAMQAHPLQRPMVFLRSWFTLQRARLRKPSRLPGSAPRRRATDPH